MFRREHIFRILGMYESLVITIKGRSKKHKEHKERVSGQHILDAIYFDMHQQNIKEYEKMVKG